MTKTKGEVMKEKFVLCVFGMLIGHSLWGQKDISGLVLSGSGKRPIEYVNIGIVGKNVGTVTNEKGEFDLFLESRYENDSLLFSCIGYEPYVAEISEIREGETIFLKEMAYNLGEVEVRPKVFKESLLGVKTTSKSISAGFQHNMLGYECGILMQVKKSAILKKVNINVSSCSYDTIFYRLNVYRVKDEKTFENILRKPIYISASKELLEDTFSVDLMPHDITVDGDFLVTLEHIKDLGEGELVFCSSKKHTTYFRKTSQGEWQTAPVGVSISVVVDVEK
ncbi:carboxypeptidase-like regulatory domain-containing protein [Parabacteroides sp. PF5-9]|uniref:carboxypeptidase-like regulatory domain-containing protein n=1 Tax=Parabacteroides sp. PF5-9 TaxID=1742404 RepID=UPI00247618BD|nr:carboxypeptidase-like regulatory domain-containing protein [Parabacteroides sp. PF5-9]MDH6358465.1 hypothetical protein [Parabacteroides sp. PF5-9]